MGKFVKMSFEGKKLYGNGQMDRKLMILKEMDPMGRSAPTPGNIHVYYHNIQRSALKPNVMFGHAWASIRPLSTISKIFSSETAWPIKAKLNVEHS